MPYAFETSPAFLAMCPAEQADYAIAQYVERLQQKTLTTKLQYLKTLEWWWTMVPNHRLLHMTADDFAVFWAPYSSKEHRTDARTTGMASSPNHDGKRLVHTAALRAKLAGAKGPVHRLLPTPRGSYKSPKSMSLATKNLRAVTMRAFLNWWYQGRAFDEPAPVTGVQLIKPDKDASMRAIKTKSLSQDTIGHLLDTTRARMDEAPAEYRAEFVLEALWIGMMYGMGLRLHEPLTIRTAPKRVMVNGDVMHQVQVVRKGMVTRDMTVPDDLLPLFDEWLRVRPIPRIAVDETAPLLIHPRTGRLLAKEWMSRRIKRVVENAIARRPDLPDFENCVFFKPAKDANGRPYERQVIKVSSHWLRHSIITHLVEEGHPLPAVAEVANHEDVQTTMIYLNAVKEKAPHILKRIRVNPRDRMTLVPPAETPSAALP